MGKVNQIDSILTEKYGNQLWLMSDILEELTVNLIIN